MHLLVKQVGTVPVVSGTRSPRCLPRSWTRFPTSKCWRKRKARPRTTSGAAERVL